MKLVFIFGYVKELSHLSMLIMLSVNAARSLRYTNTSHSSPSKFSQYKGSTSKSHSPPSLLNTGIHSSSQNQKQEPLPLAREGETGLWASGCLFIPKRVKGTPTSKLGSCASTPCASGSRRQPDNQKVHQYLLAI